MAKEEKPVTVNGITYANQAELDRRIESDLTELARITFDIYQDHKARERRLEQEPGGFSFQSDGRMCRLCMGGGKGEMWYDKLGMRCMDCQAAYKAKIIPGYVFTDKDNKRHVTDTGLVVRFKIDRRLIKKLMREGKIKARTISHKPYMDTLVFLKHENPNIRDIILLAQS